MKPGLERIIPDHRDYSLLHSFGAIAPDAKSLPADFSIYDGRVIPNQGEPDTRFAPPLEALWYGCTGETAAFDCGIQDTDLYNPKDTYVNTPPGDFTSGRDIRLVMSTLKYRGPCNAKSVFGPKRPAYFNVYGRGVIDDFDAVRISLYLFQNEKRGVWVGSWWYPEFAVPKTNGTVATPSYNINEASLHCHLITGWKTINGEPHLESISWQGMGYGDQGKVYFSRAQYNQLIKQPYTGAFTATKSTGVTPITLGMQVYLDHLIYFIVSLFNKV